MSNDALRYLAKPRDVSRMALETSERACVDLALSYARGGFTAVIDGVSFDPDFVDSMCLEMARSGVRPDVFTLDVGLGDLLDRNASRTESAQVPTDRIRELHGRFEPCGTMLSVRDMPPEEVAADIRDIVESRDTEGGTGEPDQGVRVLFLRHGEPDYPYGQYPDPRRVPLSARGRAQALAARPAVERFAPTAVYASDTAHALQTAQIACASCDATIEAAPALRERCCPSPVGFPIAEVHRVTGGGGDEVPGDSDLRSPAGEGTLDAAVARVGGFLDDVVARGAGQRVPVVGHRGPHAWTISRLLGAPVQVDRALDLGHAAFSLFSFAPNDRGKIDFINRESSGVGWSPLRTDVA
ncbi:histidine phosphatase family protein [Streptomyces bohaiensis]|uniref:histidine phosphatase family protein n=1 Tax=Streptomyces bohaiensis TaxID=1431344 RepID=UPI0014397458|nr:histidine phosphatase family protein [Streptomyces bohaiensis]